MIDDVIVWCSYCRSHKPDNAPMPSKSMTCMPQDAYEYVMQTTKDAGYINSHGICEICMEIETRKITKYKQKKGRK